MSPFDDLEPKPPLPPLHLPEHRKQPRSLLDKLPDRQDLLKHYSLSRAILEHVQGQGGYELEVSRAIAFELDREPRGLYVPLNLPFTTRAGLDSKTTAAGLELKYTEPGDLIELLRAKARVYRLGARFMGPLQGNVAFPRLTGATTGAWVSENPGSDTADSNVTFDRASLAPKLFQGTTSYSLNLLHQSTPDAEDVVRQDLALITAIALDAAAIAGTGGNQPTGILNLAAIPTVALGTNGAIPKFDDLTNLEETLGVANSDIGQMGWLVTPGLRRRFRKVPKIDFAAAGDPTWEGDNTMIGYHAESSTSVPSNLTKGTSTTICHAILFGNWQDLLIAQWGALDIIIDPMTKKKQNMVEVTSLVGVDVAVRHPASFVKVVDALK